MTFSLTWDAQVLCPCRRPSSYALLGPSLTGGDVDVTAGWELHFERPTGPHGIILHTQSALESYQKLLGVFSYFLQAQSHRSCQFVTLRQCCISNRSLLGAHWPARPNTISWQTVITSNYMLMALTPCLLPAGTGHHPARLRGLVIMPQPSMPRYRGNDVYVI